MPEMEARSPAENRHGRAPRGERPAAAGRAAPRSACPGKAGTAFPIRTCAKQGTAVAPDSATNEILRLFGAPPAPHGADGKEEAPARAQNAPREGKELCVCDMVRGERMSGVVPLSRRIGGPSRAPHASRRRAAQPKLCRRRGPCPRCAAPQHEGERAAQA